MIFPANTVAYGENKVVFGAYTVIVMGEIQWYLGVNTVIFLAYKVAFGGNTGFFLGTYSGI